MAAIEIASFVIGVIGLVVGVAGSWFGYDQWRAGKKVSAQLERLEASLRDRPRVEQKAVVRAILEELRAQYAGTLKPPHFSPSDVADAIERLPEREKLVVTLLYYEQLPIRDIAEILGVPETDVRRLSVEAIRHMREALPN